MLLIFNVIFVKLAKHTRVSFPHKPYTPSSPFSLIHSDVWGPSKVTTSSGKRWFITFIDDHTRITWVYLLRHKSETCQVFKNFHKMIQTQYQTSIRTLRTDNGTEYFNTTLSPYLLQNGIVHQSSCVDTPQQNGVAERKNRHLLEVARAIMFNMNVPKYLWGDAVLTATYLINRLPSRPLQFKTPYSILQSLYPHISTNTLPVKVFGCTTFVHVHSQHRSKLDPKAIKTVFLGYSSTQKGYRCYCPLNKKIYISSDVTFFENTPYFTPTTLQGEHIHHEKETQWSWGLELPLDMSFPSENIIIPEPENPSPSPPSSHGSQDQNKQKEIRVYTRRERNKQVTNSHHSQEANPVIEPSQLKDSGTLLSNTQSDLDIPIALRKGRRSCTQHPISNFISYAKLSSPFKAFTTGLSDVVIPRNINEALSTPQWKTAVLEEMKALEQNDTWRLVELPPNKKIIGCKWVFTVKYNASGTVERYKARLVAKGFTQTYGIDYTETFAPVAKLNTIRVLLSLAVNLDWELHQLDVKNAFLNGELEEEVYMSQPPGFEDSPNTTKVCKLNKSLYGLKQSPRAWFNRFLKVIKGHGYIQGQTDHTLFIKHSERGKMSVLIVYVDDIVITGNHTEEMIRIKEMLAKEFEVKDLGKLKYFLGMEFARSKK